MDDTAGLQKTLTSCFDMNAVVVLDTQQNVLYASNAFLSLVRLPRIAHGTPFDSLFKTDISRFIEDKQTNTSAFTAEGTGSGMVCCGIAMRSAEGITLVFDGDIRRNRPRILLDALNEAAAGMLGVNDVEAIYRTAAGILKKNGLDSMIFLFDTELFSVKALYHSFDKDVFGSLNRQVETSGEAFIGETDSLQAVLNIVSGNKPVFSDSTTGLLGMLLPGTAGITEETAAELGAGKSIAVPMKINDDTVGILLIMSDDLSKNDTPSVTAYANQMAAAFDKVTLIETLEAGVDKLEKVYEEHRELGERFELAKYAGRIGFWDLNIHTGEMTWDDMMHQLYEIAPDDSGIVTFGAWRQRIHPDDLPGINQKRERAIADGDMFNAEYRVLARDGGIRHFKTAGIPYTNDRGEAVRMVGTTWDITETVTAEREHKRALDRLELAKQAGQVGVWEYDLEADHVYWDDTMYQLFDLKLDEGDMSSDLWAKTVHPDDLEGAKARRQYAIDHNEQYQTEYRIIHTDGSIHYVKSNGIGYLDAGGKMTRLVGVTWDITELVTARQETSEILDRLEIATNAGGVGVWELDLIENKLHWDKQMMKLYQVPEDAEVGVYETWEKAVHPDDLPLAKKQLQDAIQGKQNYNVEFRIVLPDGGVRHIKADAVLRRDKSGNPARIIGTNWDVTDLVAMQQAHLQTLERLELATKAGGAGIWDWNVQTGELLWDDQMFALYDVAPETFKGNFSDWEKTVHPDDLPVVVERIQDALKHRKIFETDLRIIWRNGEVRHLLGYGHVHTNEQGEPERMIGINWDITDIRQAQAELDRSEKLLQKMFDVLPVGVWYADKDGNFISANPTAKDIWGVTPRIEKEGYGKTSARYYPSMKELAAEDWALAKLIGKGETTGEQMIEIDTYDGKKKIIINECLPLYNKGELDGAMILNTDVTRRQKAEEALQREKELMRITLQSIGDGVVVTDAQGKITMLNSVFESFSGWTEEEAVGRDFEDIVRIVHEKTRRKAASPVCEALNKGKTVSISSHSNLIRKDGEEIPIADSAAPIKDENGSILGVVLVVRDITEERQKRKKIDYLVHHDSLTGLYNRRYFEQELRRLDNEEDLPLSIVCCDVNGLKLTNDAFGHGMGDKLLKTMAKTIRKACRKNDVVARSGGDEFYILLPGTDANRAAQVCSRIRALVDAVDLGEVDFSLSVGCDTKYETADVAVTLKNAEDNMYREKFIEVRNVHDKAIHTVLAALHKKSQRERRHSHRVSELSRQIGRMMQLDADEIDDLGIVGAMHDIGKTSLSEALLEKTGKLTAEEETEMRKNPEVGFRILRASDELERVADDILAHHEHWDGTGYPKGLKGEEIPLKARIVAVADEFTMRVSEDSEGGPVSQDEALAELDKQSRKVFDPRVVEAIHKLFKS